MKVLKRCLNGNQSFLGRWLSVRSPRMLLWFLLVIFAFNFYSLTVLSSAVFAIQWFRMPLEEKHLNQLRRRTVGTLLLQNAPQLVLQLYIIFDGKVQNGNAENPIVLIAISSSILNLIVSLISWQNARHSFFQNNTETYSFKVIYEQSKEVGKCCNCCRQQIIARDLRDHAFELRNKLTAEYDPVLDVITERKSPTQYRLKLTIFQPERDRKGLVAALERFGCKQVQYSLGDGDGFTDKILALTKGLGPYIEDEKIEFLPKEIKLNIRLKDAVNEEVLMACAKRFKNQTKRKHHKIVIGSELVLKHRESRILKSQLMKAESMKTHDSGKIKRFPTWDAEELSKVDPSWMEINEFDTSATRGEEGVTSKKRKFRESAKRISELAGDEGAKDVEMKNLRMPSSTEEYEHYGAQYPTKASMTEFESEYGKYSSVDSHQKKSPSLKGEVLKTEEERTSLHL